MEQDFLMIRIPADLKRELKRRAEEQRRDMSKHVIFLIEQDLKATEQVPTPTTDNLTQQ